MSDASGRPLGARPRDDGLTEFRVWAPSAKSISLHVRGSDVPVQDAGGGVSEAVTPASAGDDYWYVVDGRRLPDPCSRWQPEGLRGPSRVWAGPSRAWAGPSRAPAGSGLAGQPAGPGRGGDPVIYELHVGTFTPEGTFDAVIPHLRELAAIGITAIEVMPIAEFPGARGWGYDGAYISAAYSCYGGPDGFVRLLDGAHAAGLAVILDVVYNHIGASGTRALQAFGPYFTDQHETLWGPAIDFTEPAVRQWVLQSALGWIEDFGVDGLRLDAVHAIVDPSPEHIVAEISRRAHEARADAFVIAEIGLTDPHDNGADACDAVWDDHFHHALHVLLTGEHDGYYAEFGDLADLAAALEQTPPQRFVIYAQNHDQVGNRAIGDRLPAKMQPLAALCTLLSGFVPLLFMGEEYGERSPFQFFSDHIDPQIARATVEGRRREFAEFTSFSGEQIPDPQARETFERSKLTRAADPQIASLYDALLALRRELPPGGPTNITFDEHERWLRFDRGPVQVACNFASEPRRVPMNGNELVVATAGEIAIEGQLTLPGLSGAVARAAQHHPGQVGKNRAS